MTFGLEQLFVGKHRSETRRARLARGIIVALVSLGAIGLFGWLFHRALGRHRWRATPCQILDSGVTVADDEGPRPYTLSVTYAFAVDGQTHTVSEDGLAAPGGSDAAAVFAKARSFPVGSERTCFVDPADGSKAVLTLPNLWAWTLATIGVALVSLALIVLYALPQILHPNTPPIAVRGGNGFVQWFYIACLAAACVIGLIWLAVRPLLENAAAARWVATPCTVEHARLSFEELHGEMPITIYRTDLLYRYTFGGTEYHSNQYSETELASPFQAGRRRRVAGLANNPKLLCLVDPYHPASAVLTRRVSPTQWLSVWVALVGGLSAYLLVPRAIRAGTDARLGRSRWTIGGLLLVLAVITVHGYLTMP